MLSVNNPPCTVLVPPPVKCDLWPMVSDLNDKKALTHPPTTWPPGHTVPQTTWDHMSAEVTRDTPGPDPGSGPNSHGGHPSNPSHQTGRKAGGQ